MLTYRVCAAIARKGGGRGALPQNNMRSTNYIRDKHRDKAGKLMASDVGGGVRVFRLWQLDFLGHRIVLQLLG